MQFQFRIFPNADDGKAAFHDALSRRDSHDTLTIHFSDSAGFEVCQISVLGSEFNRSVDAGGKFQALDVNSSGYCGRKDFEAADTWTLSWKTLPDATPKIDIGARLVDAPRSPRPARKALVPASEAKPVPSLELKPPTVPEKWKNRANWRRLAKGMTKEQVRALLGEPEKTEAVGFEYWFYGDGIILSGPYVEFYSNTVHGWKGP